MNSIEVKDGVAYIIGWNFVRHDGYVHKIDLLLDTLHKLDFDSVQFNMQDGAPIDYSGFDKIIERVQTTYNLRQDQVRVFVVDSTPPYINPTVTVDTYPSRSFNGTRKFLSQPNWNVDPTASLFGGIYGRYTLHRFLMAHYLETQLTRPSFVVFHPTRDHVDLGGFEEQYSTQLAWLTNRQESNSTFDYYNFHPHVHVSDALNSYGQLWTKFQIEIDIENNIFDYGWFTEKTTRCLYTGKPFILMGTVGQLAKLHTMGFRTFAPWIDESYDQEPNMHKRFDLICHEISRLDQLPKEQLDQVIKEINSIAEYNKTVYNQIADTYYKQSPNSHFV